MATRNLWPLDTLCGDVPRPNFSMSFALYIWLTPIMTARDIVPMCFHIICNINCFCTFIPRLMVVSFGVSGGDGTTNVGSRCRNGFDGRGNGIDDQAGVELEKSYCCWYESLQSCVHPQSFTIARHDHSAAEVVLLWGAWKVRNYWFTCVEW